MDSGRFQSRKLELTLTFQISTFFFCFLARFSRRSFFEDYFRNDSFKDTGCIAGSSFVGIVWAAFHFFSDFSFMRATDLMVLEHLGTRLFMCETLSFVLGWLTLRSKSVIPSAVAAP